MSTDVETNEIATHAAPHRRSLSSGEGRLVFVSGAASGIGRSAAHALARAGYAVAAFDRDRPGLERTMSEIETRGHTPAIGTVGDVASEADVADCITRAQDRFGPLHGAVASAGIWTAGTALEVSLERGQRTFDVNTTGTLIVARQALQSFLETGNGGSIVAVASDVGLQGSQECAAYVASKHATVGLIKTLALDYSRHEIRANAVCPGFVHTPMSEHIFSTAPEAVRQARIAEQPAGRFAETNEVAELIAFLIGDHSRSINGAAITCDGGSSAGYYHMR